MCGGGGKLCGELCCLLMACHTSERLGQRRIQQHLLEVEYGSFRNSCSFGLPRLTSKASASASSSRSPWAWGTERHGRVTAPAY